MHLLESKIRMGICGAGNIVHTHCNTLARFNNMEIMAVSSRSKEQAHAVASQYHIKDAFNDHRYVTEHPDVDIVLVTCPNYQHFELSMQAIEAGKHVIVEKPLAMNIEQALMMIEAAEKAGVMLLYAENLPFAPKFMKLTEMAEQGAFGEIYMLRQIERHAGPHSPWFFQKECAGGGVLMDLGCHSISVLLETMKGHQVIDVGAVARTFRHKHGDVEDFIIMQMVFDNGAIGVVESNWCHLGGMDSITEIFGSEGQGYADLMKGSGLETYIEKEWLLRGRDASGWRKPVYDALYEFGYVGQMQAMSDCLLKGAAPRQSGRDGLRVLEIMTKAYKAAESQKGI